MGPQKKRRICNVLINPLENDNVRKRIRRIINVEPHDTRKESVVYFGTRVEQHTPDNGSVGSGSVDVSIWKLSQPESCVTRTMPYPMRCGPKTHRQEFILGVDKMLSERTGIPSSYLSSHSANMRLCTLDTDAKRQRQ